jgi:uncharacterized protein YsxB (DUF464 family)
MVTIKVTSRSDGQFLSCRAEGHAFFGKPGTDIVCAAVSMLLRTVHQGLSNTAGLAVETEAGEKGAFAFSVRPQGGCPNRDGLQAILGFTRDLLCHGFASLETEYPGSISLRETILTEE